MMMLLLLLLLLMMMMMIDDDDDDGQCGPVAHMMMQFFVIGFVWIVLLSQPFWHSVRDISSFHQGDHPDGTMSGQSNWERRRDAILEKQTNKTMQRTQSTNKRTNERTNNRNETKRNERMNRRTRRRVATCRVATCCDATCRDATRRDPTCREDFLTYFGHSWYFESDSFKCHHVRWYCISMAYERGGTSGW